MAAVVRIGDPNSHGGQVLGGSPDLNADTLAVARVGDPVSCPIHGDNAIATAGQSSVTDEAGKLVAVVGGTCECGATLTGGSPDVNIG